MDTQELEKRIKAANEKFVSGEDAGGNPAAPVSSGPTDVYKSRVKARRDELKKRYPKGSSAMVRVVAKSVLTGDGAAGAGLAPHHKRAKDDSDYYRERGELDKAEIVRNQYMEERFLPAVETIIAYTSPDEVLNCKDVLSELDKFVLGTGRSDGYTAQYIRSSYNNALGEDLSARIGKSDDFIRRTVLRIKMLADGGMNREAISLAVSAKKQVDDGSHIANDEDYEIIGRVAAFA